MVILLQYEALSEYMCYPLTRCLRFGPSLRWDAMTRCRLSSIRSASAAIRSAIFSLTPCILRRNPLNRCVPPCSAMRLILIHG